MPRPVAVIAARNEQDLLPQTLRALSSIPLALILVVDDGSTDATAATARTLGAQVLPAAPPDSPATRAGPSGWVSCTPGRSPRSPLLLADADLGASARHLSSLLAALGPDTPAAVAAFPPRPAVASASSNASPGTRSPAAPATTPPNPSPASGPCSPPPWIPSRASPRASAPKRG